MPLPKEQEKALYTYDDYCHWPEDAGRFEIIEGVEFSMSPGPGTQHQLICGNLFRILGNFFQGKPCQVLIAPFDIRLPQADEADNFVRTVVQPDISIICDPKKLDEKGCRGSPDLVVEILSPSTASKDHIKKRALYESHGVKEYWLVHPTDHTVMVYRLDTAGKYSFFLVLDDTNKLSTPLFPRLEVDLSVVFQTRADSVKETSHPLTPAPRKTRAKRQKDKGQ